MRIKKEREGNLVHVEVTTVPGHYVSYLVWQADSLLQGEETTDDRGLRRTPGNSDDPDAFNIFVFGGSAMWGSGVPDSCTIASRLRENLAASTDLRVSVTNYGQISWVSSQELLSLLLELRDGRIPDLVIFYDGFNDVWSSYQVGRAGEHQNYPQIRDRVEGIDILRVQNSLFAQLVGRTNTAQLIQLMRTAGTLAEEPREIITYATMGTDPVALAESTFAVYRRNMEMASLLGDGFGFDCLFIWQPCIWCGSKPMTENEHDIWVGVSCLPGRWRSGMEGTRRAHPEPRCVECRFLGGLLRFLDSLRLVGDGVLQRLLRLPSESGRERVHIVRDSQNHPGRSGA